jgi:hypothetical protein
MRLSRVLTKTAAAAALATLPLNLPALQPDLELLGSFETLESLGFTPDDVVFNPARGTLLISSAADSVVPPSTQGVYEVTQDGALLQHIATPPGVLLGFSITRATSGPQVGHYFMAEFNGSPSVSIFEFDRDFVPVNEFLVSGVASPGDGLAFNHLTRTLMLVDGGFSHLVEVTTAGDPIRLIPALGSHVVGLTFNQPTGTYLGVDSGGIMREFSTDGDPLRVFDLTVYGIKNSVGIAAGQGKLFIADEDDPPNTGGAIYTLRSPRRQ